MNAIDTTSIADDRDPVVDIEGPEIAIVDCEASAPDIVAGDIISGKFRVCRVLGVGGMGTVVEATHLGLEEPVAVKILNREVGDDENAHERLFREAKATAKIRSEHAVKVTDVGKLEDGRPYLVMEYLQGRDLGDRLDHEGALTIREACDVIIQVCDALSDAHELGIIHRDLKPSNLFQTTDRDGQVCIKVLDFGISKATKRRSEKRLTEDNTILGTPEYMSPEQLRGADEIDARSDIWSLGVILFELLTNRVPFFGDTTTGIFAAILTDPPVPIAQIRRDVPNAIASAIDRCLSKNIDDRFVDVGELSWALAPFASDARRRLAERTARRSSSKIIALEVQNEPKVRQRVHWRLFAIAGAAGALVLAIVLWAMAPKATSAQGSGTIPTPTNQQSPANSHPTAIIVAPETTPSATPIAVPRDLASSAPPSVAESEPTKAPANVGANNKSSPIANAPKVPKKSAEDPFGRQR